MSTSVESGQVIPVTWKIALRVWWAWMWRAVLVASGVGFVLGVGSVLIQVFANANFGIVPALISSLFGFLIGLFYLKKILSKDFGDFKIVFIKK